MRSYLNLFWFCLYTVYDSVQLKELIDVCSVHKQNLFNLKLAKNYYYTVLLAVVSNYQVVFVFE